MSRFAKRLCREPERQAQRDELARQARPASRQASPHMREWAPDFLQQWIRQNNDRDGCRALRGQQ